MLPGVSISVSVSVTWPLGFVVRYISLLLLRAAAVMTWHALLQRLAR